MRVICVEHVSKKFVLAHERSMSLAQAARSMFSRTTREDFWALNDISFDVEQGETVGIIGRNGAGKSTILKLITGIMQPTKGRIRTRGRICSLLEVGAGFHPEMTGRENIYLNGSILGMTRREIDSKVDEIVSFAGLEKFIDTPVKRYSSGMYARLGFSVAAHVDPDILIVDEVLSVGDAAFQAKCMSRMERVSQSEGRTVVYVSHNLSSVQALCSRAILIRQGSLVCNGDSASVVAEYVSGLEQGAHHAFDDNPDRSGTGALRLIGAAVLARDGTPVKTLVAGEGATFAFDYTNPNGLRRVDVKFSVISSHDVPSTNIDMGLTDFVVDQLVAQGTFLCHLDRVPFPIGRYRVAIAVSLAGELLDHMPNAIVFDVGLSTFFPTGRTPEARYCGCMVDHRWEHLVGPVPDRYQGE